MNGQYIFERDKSITTSTVILFLALNKKISFVIFYTLKTFDKMQQIHLALTKYTFEIKYNPQ